MHEKRDIKEEKKIVEKEFNQCFDTWSHQSYQLKDAFEDMLKGWKKRIEGKGGKLEYFKGEGSLVTMFQLHVEITNQDDANAFYNWWNQK